MPASHQPFPTETHSSLTRSAKDHWLGWHPRSVGVLVMLLFAVPGLAVIWNVHERASQVLEESIRSSLMMAARTVAEVVSPAKHSTFLRREQEETPEYLEAIQNMRRMQSALDSKGMIKYVYTCVMKDDGVHLVLDTSPEGDLDKDGQEDKSHIMEPYEQASETLRAVLKSGTAAVEPLPYTDKWGTFMSAYAPIKDGSKVVAAACVDMALNDYDLQLSGIHHVGRLSALGTVSLSLVAGVLMAGYHRRLQKTVGQLIVVRDAALAASHAKSQFLAAMSHELRTPMNAVLGMSELLAETTLNGHQKELVGTIQSSGESLLLMISDVLDFSQLDSGDIEVKPEPLNLAEMIDGLHQQFGPEAQKKNLSLGMDLNPGCPKTVKVDGVRVRQVLRHLISNAIKFTDAGTVKLSVSPEQVNKLHFTVRDTGIGISEQQKAGLFQAFSQGDGSNTRRHGGMGVGLALCQRLSQAIGGRIWMHSTEGKGSEFHFEVPFEVLPDAESSPVKARALVATQDRMTSIMVQGFFEKQGHSVHIVDSVAAMRASLSERPVSWVLVDLNLPDAAEAKTLSGSFRLIGLNADVEAPKDGFEMIQAAPTTPASLRSVLN